MLQKYQTWSGDGWRICHGKSCGVSSYRPRYWQISTWRRGNLDRCSRVHYHDGNSCLVSIPFVKKGMSFLQSLWQPKNSFLLFLLQIIVQCSTHWSLLFLVLSTHQKVKCSWLDSELRVLEMRFGNESLVVTMTETVSWIASTTNSIKTIEKDSKQQRKEPSELPKESHWCVETSILQNGAVPRIATRICRRLWFSELSQHMMASRQGFCCIASVVVQNLVWESQWRLVVSPHCRVTLSRPSGWTQERTKLDLCLFTMKIWRDRRWIAHILFQHLLTGNKNKQLGSAKQNPKSLHNQKLHTRPTENRHHCMSLSLKSSVL